MTTDTHKGVIRHVQHNHRRRACTALEGLREEFLKGECILTGGWVSGGGVVGRHERHQQGGRASAPQERVCEQAWRRLARGRVPNEGALHEAQQVGRAAGRTAGPGRRHVADATHRLQYHQLKTFNLLYSQQ